MFIYLLSLTTTVGLRMEVQMRLSKSALALIIVSLLTPGATFASAAQDTPLNAHRSTVGGGWECNRGYVQVGQECRPVAIPANAILDRYGRLAGLADGPVVAHMTGTDVERQRWRAGGARVGDLGGQTQMTQDPLNHRCFFNQCDQSQAPATPRTGQHVNAEAAAH